LIAFKLISEFFYNLEDSEQEISLASISAQGFQVCNFWMEQEMLWSENSLQILNENLDSVVDLINEANDAAHFLGIDNIVEELIDYAN